MPDENHSTITPCRKITAEYIRARLDYDPATGVFLWRACDVMPVRWNSRWAGKIAGTDHNAGYRTIVVNGSKNLAHRLAWLITTGDWPADQIDHLNGDPSDNRIENLRAVNSAKNMRNLKIPSTNRSGHIGVCWSSVRGKWVASIKVDGKSVNLGRFTAIADAIAARAAASASHGYHQNHGRTK